MASPTPPVSLKDHCSVVYQNTLYTFQPDAFQSLHLQSGAQWSQLSMGVSTRGSVCVQGSSNGDDAIYIVGGITNSSAQSYSGLQRYSFKAQKWEELKPNDSSAQNRLGHGSVFLNSSSSILIYGGSQDGGLKSSQTFTISTLPPYTVRAFRGDAAPPVIKPLMLPFNSSHALMLGGDLGNEGLYTFSPEEEWHQFNVRLKHGLNTNDVQAVIADSSDGSKMLELFDMNASPNTISTLLLQRPTGTTPRNSIPFSPSTTQTPQPSRKRKRQNPPTDRPPYNSTLASQTQRSNFSLAQDPNGLVVVSGGAPGGEDVLCLFNQTGNQWIDPSRFFELHSITTNDPTPTSSSPIASLTQTALSSSTAAPNSNSRRQPLTILGATLGAVFGLVAILIIVLLLLRCLRLRRTRKHKRRSSEYALGNKREMDFADRGAEFMREAGGSSATKSNHQPTDSGNTINSLAIMSGGARAGSQRSKRSFFHKTGDSSGSAKSFFSRTRSPLAPSPPHISGPIQPINSRDNYNQIGTSPEPRTEPRTDTGWSRYWANNSTTNLGQSGPGHPHHDSASRPTTYASNSQSDYGSSRITSSNAHESAEVQPLSLRTNLSHPSNTRVVSPTSGLPLPGLALSSGASDDALPSPSTLVSDINEEEDEYHNHEDERHASEGMASWTPVAPSDRGSTWTDRPSSSYADSTIYPHPGERVRIPNFPGVPSTTQNSTARNSQVEPPSSSSMAIAPAPPTTADGRGMRSLAVREFRTPPATAAANPVHDRELPEVGSRRMVPPHAFGYAPDGRAYPRRPDEVLGSSSRGARGERDAEDMSWLNLGR